MRSTHRSHITPGVVPAPLGDDVCATCPRRDEAAHREGWYYMI